MSVNAIKFPEMISSTGQANLIFNREATYQNLKYLLLSTKKTLLGDPYYGTRLRDMIFEKNNPILRDLVVDDIYTNIRTYMPQIRIDRKNIEVTSNGKIVQVTIVAQNVIDFKFDDYTIKLLDVEEI